jgi:NADH dehydrogenase (ubiquinone) 1 alpha subcomplex subunit 5
MFASRLRVPLRALCTAVESTPIVGVKKERFPRQVLQSLYSRTLADIAEIPETAAYRRNVEKITRDRMSALEASASLEEFEDRVGVGIVEEVIKQARDELSLITKMKQWQPWAQ